MNDVKIKKRKGTLRGDVLPIGEVVPLMNDVLFKKVYGDINHLERLNYLLSSIFGKEVNVIEERPEDEEKDKDNKIKIKDEKRKFKNYNKRVITGNKEGFSMNDFLMSKGKK